MTIIEAINKVDALKPNTYTQTDKIKWLSDLDGMIKRDVIDTHEGGEDVDYAGYTDETPLDKVLLVGSPYEDIYIAWLESKFDFHNGEYGKYNNSIIRFTDLQMAYANDYNRSHMPKGRRIRYF